MPQNLPARGHSTGALIGTALASGLLAVLLSRNFFEYEKKLRQLITTDYSVGEGAFARTVSQLLGPPLVEGNAIDVLQNGAEIFPAMLQAIRSARRSITFENFIFVEGEVSDQFSEALAEQARAGVKVHFLQDAMGSNCLHGRAFKLMKRAGVEVEIFRYLHLTQFNHRTHRKLLIIDGSTGFIGGVGISDDWAGHGDCPGKWRDTQYRVAGPVVGQLQQAFMDNWLQTRATVLHGDDYFPELMPAGEISAQGFQSSACEGSDSARLMFLFSIAAARKSIRIANAFFIPDDLTIRTLVVAAMRGVKIEVIAPSDLNDQHLARLVGRSRWRKLFKAGVHFYEFQKALFHCKYMIVDDCWVCVGSCNLDDRSLRLNDEANLNILDEKFAAGHIDIFEQDKAASVEITFQQWRHRPWREKIQGHAGNLLRSQM
ncbi:MAG: phospholipase D/Transphosphatidylase [Verrucomicrobiaceae bacterium]|nr:phospholipase D/Transphosphatidylase [Verrucomicrobiaceae bacterium]